MVLWLGVLFWYYSSEFYFGFLFIYKGLHGGTFPKKSSMWTVLGMELQGVVLSLIGQGPVREQSKAALVCRGFRDATDRKLISSIVRTKVIEGLVAGQGFSYIVMQWWLAVYKGLKCVVEDLGDKKCVCEADRLGSTLVDLRVDEDGQIVVNISEHQAEGNKLVAGKRYAFRLKKKADGGWELADEYMLGNRMQSVKERALCVAACEIEGLKDLPELLQSGLLRRRAVVVAKD